MIKIDSTYFIEPEQPENSGSGEGSGESDATWDDDYLSYLSYDDYVGIARSLLQDYKKTGISIDNTVYDNTGYEEKRKSDETLEFFIRKYKKYF